MQQYGYKRFLEECSLVISGSKTCNTATLISSSSLTRSQQPHEQSIGRWLQTLVRIAANRYVLPGGLPDHKIPRVTDALKELLSTDIRPHVDPRALEDTNAFRRDMYTQDVRIIISSTATQHRTTE